MKQAANISTIRSMTGYGRAEGRKNGAALTVELRSVNHRYCDLSVKLPKRLVPFEEAVKNQLKQSIQRGHVDLSVNLAMPQEESYALDLSSAKCHYQMLKQLKKGLGLTGAITFDQVTRFRDFIIPAESVPSKGVGPWLKQVLGDALLALDQMRRREGEAIVRDISARIKDLSKTVAQITIRQKEGLDERYQRLCKRVSELAHTVDSQRMAQELALMVNRDDISEEIARLEAHLAEFGRLLNEAAPAAVGRQLDFLTQEINREINTLGSKANDEKIAQQVVAMKCEMEKVREQVQNIE